MRSNIEAIERALEGKDVVLARVDACLGNAQFRLKYTDGKEGRGTPLGKYTFSTLRIAPGQFVVCEPGNRNSILTIVGRFDSRKDVKELVRRKLVPKAMLNGDDDGACFDDGFEFEDEEDEQEEAKEDDEDDRGKVHKLVDRFSKKTSRVTGSQQLQDEADAMRFADAEMEKAYYELHPELVTEKRRKTKKAKTALSSIPEAAAEAAEDETDHTNFTNFRTKVADNWEDEIDIDAI